MLSEAEQQSSTENLELVLLSYAKYLLKKELIENREPTMKKLLGQL